MKHCLMVDSDRSRCFSVSSSASMSDGFNLSSGMAPNGDASKCLREMVLYSDLVAGLRSEAARLVARQCDIHAATVAVASLTGAPASTRLRSSRILARTMGAVAPYTDTRLRTPVAGSVTLILPS